MSEIIANTKIGFFGKQPQYGDFLSRHLPGSFTTPWDHWLEISVNESLIQLGEEWLDTYLSSPLWRFALSSGICDTHCWAGILMPSVDKVGRYYPFTLVQQLPVNTNLLALITDNEAWFNQCEELALSTLLDCFDLSDFQKETESITPPVTQISLSAAPQELPAQHFTLPCLDPFGEGVTSLSDTIRIPFPHTLWWTHGSQQVKPSLLIASGLPTSCGYSSMLNGNWEYGGWKHQE